jgi:hypothetical protein
MPLIAARSGARRFRVTPPRDCWQMDADEVIERAREEGFEFGWRYLNDGHLCVGFTRGDDTRYPAFGEERLAIDYMAD